MEHKQVSRRTFKRWINNTPCMGDPSIDKNDDCAKMTYKNNAGIVVAYCIYRKGCGPNPRASQTYYLRVLK